MVRWTLPALDRDIDTLRRLGGLKWTMFPDAIGAFVAEMDFGTAPPVTAALHAAVDGESFGYLPAALRGGDGVGVRGVQPGPVRLGGRTRPTSARSPM